MLTTAVRIAKKTSVEEHSRYRHQNNKERKKDNDGTAAVHHQIDGNGAINRHLDHVGEPYSAGERVAMVDDWLPVIAVPAVQLHAPAALAKVVDVPKRST